MYAILFHTDMLFFFKGKKKNRNIQKKLKQHYVHLHTVDLESLFSLDYLILLKIRTTRLIENY